MFKLYESLDEHVQVAVKESDEYFFRLQREEIKAKWNVSWITPPKPKWTERLRRWIKRQIRELKPACLEPPKRTCYFEQERALRRKVWEEEMVARIHEIEMEDPAKRALYELRQERSNRL